MTLPSKELLSAVMKRTILTAKQDPQFDTYVILNRNTTLNLYELMHMMKEWANKQSYWLDSGAHSKGWEATYVNKDLSSQLSGYMLCSTEFEAVTQACEYILKETT